MLLAILPARGGSERIKNKNIVDFCGKPLIHYSLDAARNSGIFNKIHVSTDSQEIAHVAADAGYPVDFLRDPALADSHTALMPVLSWALSQYDKQGLVFHDICLLMPTAPLVMAEDLRNAYDLFQRRGKVHPLLAMTPFPVPVDWAMEINQEGCTFAREPAKLFVRSQDLKPCFYDSGAFVFYTADQIRNPDTSGTYLAYPLPKSRSVDIDDQEDLEMAEILYRGWRARQLA